MIFPRRIRIDGFATLTARNRPGPIRAGLALRCHGPAPARIFAGVAGARHGLDIGFRVERGLNLNFAPAPRNKPDTAPPLRSDKVASPSLTPWLRKSRSHLTSQVCASRIPA